MLVSDAVDKFLRLRRVGRYSPHTLSEYGRDLRQFREHVAVLIGHEPEVTEITRELITIHLAELAGRLARTSAARHRDCLKTFFVWLDVGEGMPNPMKGMLFPRAPHPRIPKFLSPAEIAAMIEAEPTKKSRGTHVRHHRALALRDRALLEVAYASGCRIAELVALNWEDLCGGMSGDIRIIEGKGGDDRVALIGEPALDALAKWKRAVWSKDLGAPIFQNQRGERLTVRAAQLVFSARAALAGIEGRVHPHMFRHSCATHLMQAGAGIADIAALLGHKSLNTTTRYTHVNVAYLSAEHRRAFPRV